MGYQCIDGELIIVPEQAIVVKMIFDFYLTGYTFAQIKAKLEKRNIKTATGKSQWDTTTIQKMLKNEKYKGDSLLQKTFTEDYLNGIRKKNEGQRPKYYVKDSHPAIISPEIFDRVQEEMFLRARLVLKKEKNRIQAIGIAANICLVIYWFVEIAGQVSDVERKEGRLYGDAEQEWRRGRWHVGVL